MSRDLVEIIVLAIWILGNRIWSHVEHKRGRDDIKEIRIYMNGEVEKRINEAYEKGKQDARNQLNEK